LANISVTVACGPYDHMEAIARGIVRPVGIDITYLDFQSPPEIFARMIKTQAFDISEMSLSSYFNLRAKGNFPFLALPVFPCRLFRHAYIFLNKEAGIRSPKDLEGQRIGVQQYRQTAATWIRGILSSEYKVDLSDVTWVEGGVNVARPPDADMDLMPCATINLASAPRGKSINDLLITGEIAAYFGARVPASFPSESHIVRLFPNYRQVEREYYFKNGIFPIMHTLVIREELHRKNPWIAENMFQAFEASKRWALEHMRFTGTMRYMVPWLNHEIEEMNEMFGGGDPYPNGLEANRKTLETLMGYLVDQAFVEGPTPAIDDFFIPIVGWLE
jgi:4,5-dihydroxyphthalate decarboxylase